MDDKAMRDLHGEIMNIPCDVARMDMNSSSEVMAYRLGHRDARHAAAELALSQKAEAPGWVRVPMEPNDAVIQAMEGSMFDDSVNIGTVQYELWVQVYKAALAAAPKEKP